MASELYNIIDSVSREKGIDPQIVVSAVEDAIVVATRKYYKTQENLRAELDKETGKIHAFAVRTVVETPEQVEDPLLQITLEEARKGDPNIEVGGEVRTPKVTEGILGRIAAQLAKQVIFQKVREAERDTARRTATSALPRERSNNFCRLRTRLRSPARDAAKIRCRSRRTFSSAWRH